MKWLMGVLATAMLPMPALAQEVPPSAPPRGLTSVGFTSSQGFFVEAPGPQSGPFETWEWTIEKAPTELGGIRYDMSVGRVRIDCTANTRELLMAHGYLGDKRVMRSAGGEPVAKVSPGTPAEAIVNIACGRVNLTKAAAIPDVASARRITAAKFGAN